MCLQKWCKHARMNDMSLKFPSKSDPAAQNLNHYCHYEDVKWIQLRVRANSLPALLLKPPVALLGFRTPIVWHYSTALAFPYYTLCPGFQDRPTNLHEEMRVFLMETLGKLNGPLSKSFWGAFHLYKWLITLIWNMKHFLHAIKWTLINVDILYT